MVDVLFVRVDSEYKNMPNVTTWDMNDNALGYNGDGPVICHPPCRAWGLSTWQNLPPERRN